MNALLHDGPERHELKLWGIEDTIVNGPQYCGKVMRLSPATMAAAIKREVIASSIHFHREKVETLHVLEGLLSIQLWKPKLASYGKDGADLILSNYEPVFCTVLRPGQALTIPQFHPHRFWNRYAAFRCVFVEFSTQDFAEDSVRINKSGAITEPEYFGVENIERKVGEKYEDFYSEPREPE